jgi:hypothetical protein
VSDSDDDESVESVVEWTEDTLVDTHTTRGGTHSFHADRIVCKAIDQNRAPRADDALDKETFMEALVGSVCARATHCTAPRALLLRPSEYSSNLFAFFEMPRAWDTLQNAVQQFACMRSVHAVCSAMLDVSRGLLELHALGFAHCDIKGANILVSAAGARLTDFGLAQCPWTVWGAGTGDGAHDIMLCTEYTRPPEWGWDRRQRLRRGAMFAGDVYSFGMTLAHLLYVAQHPGATWPASRVAIMTLRQRGAAQAPAFVRAHLPRATKTTLKLLEACLNLRTSKRPGARALCDGMAALVSELDNGKRPLQEMEAARAAAGAVVTPIRSLDVEEARSLPCAALHQPQRAAVWRDIGTSDSRVAACVAAIRVMALVCATQAPMSVWHIQYMLTMVRAKAINCSVSFCARPGATMDAWFTRAQFVGVLQLAGPACLPTPRRCVLQHAALHTRARTPAYVIARLTCLLFTVRGISMCLAAPARMGVALSSLGGPWDTTHSVVQRLVADGLLSAARVCGWTAAYCASMRQAILGE